MSRFLPGNAKHDGKQNSAAQCCMKPLSRHDLCKRLPVECHAHHIDHSEDRGMCSASSYTVLHPDIAVQHKVLSHEHINTACCIACKYNMLLAYLVK
jgi:hypothetical protein